MDTAWSMIIGIITRNMMTIGSTNWARKKIAPRSPATSVKRRLDPSDRYPWNESLGGVSVDIAGSSVDGSTREDGLLRRPGRRLLRGSSAAAGAPLPVHLRSIGVPLNTKRRGSADNPGR
jgi:hypothetical protein